LKTSNSRNRGLRIRPKNEHQAADESPGPIFEDLPEAAADICEIFDSYQLAGNKLAIQMSK
jgi:hypothetical protein